MLYRAQELESHLALELLERALRLALGPERMPDNVTDGETGNYTKEEEDDDEESGSSGGSQPSWEEGFSGQRLSGGHRPAIQFDGPDHQDRPGAHQAPQAPPTWHGPRFEHSQIN
jgi:hypothetical protein